MHSLTRASALSLAVLFACSGQEPAKQARAAGKNLQSRLPVFVGYADNLRPNPNFPVPWAGSPNVLFLGGCSEVDAGAIRLDNPGATPLAVDGVTVDLERPGPTFNLWGAFTIPAGGSAILTQQSCFDFDTSDFPITGCGQTAAAGDPRVPRITVTAGGVSADYFDTGHILDTGGFDLACIGNESLQWRPVGTAGSTAVSDTLTLAPASASLPVGSSYTATATLLDPSGSPVPNVTVSFKVTLGPDAGRTFSAATDAQGKASVSFSGATPGADTLVATVANAAGGSFDSNTVSVSWNSADVCPAAASPGPQAPALTWLGASEGEFGDPFALAALLTDGNGTPLAGRSLTFTLGAQSASATTDARGVGRASIVPSGTPGPTPLAADFAGDASTPAAHAALTASIGRDETAVRYTGRLALAAGVEQHVSAVLHDPEDGAPVAGRSVTFQVAGVSAAAVTDAAGAASATLTIPAQALGPASLAISFAGDAFLLPSSATAQVIAFAQSGFVVWGGNPSGLHLGDRVNPWGAQWQDQVLAGDYQDNGAFKGYADFVAAFAPCEPDAHTAAAPRLDQGCWSTRPGNSHPPATVPPWLGVLVSTAIDKSGPDIYGNVVGTVVVKVDPSNFQPDPGHRIYGTIVAGVDGAALPPEPALVASQAQPAAVLPGQPFSVELDLVAATAAPALQTGAAETFFGSLPAEAQGQAGTVTSDAHAILHFAETAPALAPRGASESSADYQSRLGAADGRALASSAVISFSDAAGQAQPPAVARSFGLLSLPRLALALTATPCVGPGSAVDYQLTVSNLGSAGSSGARAAVTFPDGSAGDAQVPDLAPGGTATVHLTWRVPVLAPKDPGESNDAYVARLLASDALALQATASVTWLDARGSSYGPVDRPVSSIERVPALQIAAPDPGVFLPGQHKALAFAVTDVGTGTVPAAELDLTQPDGTAAPGSIFGLSAGQSTTETVSAGAPPVAPRTVGESDLAYLTRLAALDGAPLSFGWSATWTDLQTNAYGPETGTLSGTEQLPVLLFTFTGPAAATSGDTLTYAFTVTNRGHAQAVPALEIVLPDGTEAEPALAPLPAGATVSGSVTYAVPASFPGGTLAATAQMGWQDAAGNAYGPLSGSASTRVTHPNLPPVVSAGPPQIVQLPAGATLSGSASDDGFPLPPALTVGWSVVSGPGSVIFGNPAAAQTSASFAAAGTYLLRLTASDGQLSASSDVTVTVRAQVTQTARIALAPSSAGPNVTGGTQRLTATVADGSSAPIAGQAVSFAIAGPNAAHSGTATTDAGGLAVFTYTGNAAGTDTVVASATLFGQTFASNASTVSWVTPVQPVSTLSVRGRFFASPDSGPFVTRPTQTPAFEQFFPTIDFNPPAGTIPGNTSPVGVTTRPFTGVTTDLNGNFTGVIVAKGNGHQAGVGDLFDFQAVFTSSFVVAGPSDIRFDFFSDDGFIFSVGNGATYVSGPRLNVPADGLSPFERLPVIGAFNQATAPVANSITVHFPAAGTYPYELDYSECCAGQLALTMASNANGGHGVPPAGSLVISPNLPAPRLAGTAQSFTVTAVDASGIAQANLDVTLAVSGPNARTLTARTDAQGRAAFSYLGLFTGADELQARATFSNSLAFSNVVNQVWQTNPNAPTVSQPARAAQPVVTGGSVALSVRATDPAGEPRLTYSWSASGPGPVVFAPNGNNAAKDTVATFSAAGTYTLQVVIADPSGFQSASSVQVQVNDTLSSVSISPGDTVLALGEVLAASATAFDQFGQPFGSGVTFHWSGAGVLFGAPDAATTDASFAATGTYPITVTASSGGLLVSATANVTVNPAATAPVVDPGPTQTITLPVDSVTLAGSVTDPGLRPGQTLTIAWTETSGPAAVAFDTPASPVTVARFIAPGAYVLRLTASDGAFLAFAETAVIVNPAAPAGTGPLVDAGPSIAITLPQNTATLQGSVSEAVLPPGAALTQSWRQVSGPATVSFTSPNSAVTAARFPLAGVYVVRLSASDGIFLNSDDTVVTVLPQPPSLVVDAGPDQTLAAGARTATLSGSISPIRATTQSAWTFVAGPSPVRFSDARQPATTVSFDLPGVYTLRLTAVDGASTAFAETHLTVPASAAPGCTPAVTLDHALDGTRVTSAVSVTGSVSCGDWLVRAALDGDGQNPAWRTVGTGSGAATGVLASFDPTQLVNGTWTLQLLSTGDGGTFATSIAVTLDRNQKVGNFAVSFSDLTLTTPGMPLTITRSYDSKDPRSGDFGNGWQLSIGNVRVEKSAPLGKFWEETASSGFFPTYCLRPTRPETVTITFPSGKLYRFDAGASPACQLLFPIEFADVVFTPAEGTVGTLTPDDTSVIVSVSALPGDATLISSGTFDVYNPVNFALTVEDGTTYFVRQGGQVQQIADPGGNTITLQGNGIIASNGASTLFTRDAAGRITSITDPNGGVLRYAYDAVGNLVSFTDRTGAVTTYGYDGEGRMARLTDPRGVDLLSNGWGPDGRLASNTDAAGQSISYSYDPANNRETVRDRAGNVTTFDYDADGNVVRTVDALGSVTTATFDDRDNKLSETDPLGHTRHWTYDAQGNQTSRTDALGNVTRYTYGPVRDLLTTTDALGRVTTEEHEDTPVCGRSPSGLFLGITNALGERTHQIYTADPAQGCVRLIDQIIDSRGAVTRYTYDSAQRVASSTNALGAVATFTYDANGNLLSKTQKRTRSDGTVESLVTRYELDANGRRTAVILPDGSTTRTVYDSLGKAVETIDALGRHTKMAYDDLGRLISTTYPDGTVASTTYTPNGKPATQTDRGGRTTRFDYDALDRPIRVTAPDGSVRTTEYDAAGRVLAQVDELGQRTTFAYDAAGRRTSMTDALGRTTAYAYDAVGNLASTTDPLGHTVSTVYDALNRASSVVYPDGTRSNTTYDAGGNRASTIDQAGFATSFAYDLAGRLATVTDARGGVTSYQYDEIGERVAQTDADGHTTRFTFDPAGRRASRTLPGGETERMTYAADGRLQARTDFNGHSTAYAYDDAGRLVLRSPDAAFAGEAPVSFTYFPSGQRKTMTDGSGTTSYTYDARDRLLSKSSPAGTLSYGYDLAGHRTSAASDSGAYSVTYAYDALNRLTSVTDHPAGGGTTTYAYDEAGRLTGEAYPNGVSSALGYDANGRLTSESIALGGATPRVLASYAYAREATGAPTTVAELSGRAVQWAYDELWRLTSETISAAPAAGAVGYSYDAVGNRLTRSSTVPGIAGQTSTYDADDRLLADGYDANGNTVSDGGRAIRYDSQDRMIALPGVVSYGYDGDGQLVSRTADGATVSYLVDALTPAGDTQIVEERQAGAVRRSFVYGLRRIALHSAAGTRYYGYDAHSGVRLLTDEAGQVTDTWDYDAFGAVIGRTGTTDNPFTYRGEQVDPLTGLQYLRARWMDPGKGRFWTRDTFEGRVEQPLSRHAYLYAHSSPVLGRDHSGHEFDEESMLVAADISAELDTMASANYSALLEAFEAGDGAAVGQAFNTFGAIAEEGADAVIESALGDSVVVDSEVTFGQVGQGASRLDRVLQSADGLRKMILEVKYSFPQKGPALTRLLNQIANASAAGEGKVVVWALTESSEAAVVEALGPAAGNVTFVNGVSELWIEISEFFGVL